ncbi:hypothetical protein AB0A77_35460 [Streptomyces varsoviensis]|uniref:hypothetical protein n=1 Tax=Streptomyces varsoviensis TaxID=67373 RepID=UPI0033DF6776
MRSDRPREPRSFAEFAEFAAFIAFIEFAAFIEFIEAMRGAVAAGMRIALAVRHAAASRRIRLAGASDKGIRS